ncbi:MAG TPA: hypothetical protein VHW60_18270 [Caulobacteraceae bacterium]|jgi:hypothetical protein|nr:hypothetical protein [Caulobacteraceae bacterium]
MRTVAISDDLAARLEVWRARTGLASLDATAEAIIVRGLGADDAEPEGADVHALLAEAEEDGC